MNLTSFQRRLGGVSLSKRQLRYMFVSAASVCALIFATLVYFSLPPSNFPTNQIITIKKNSYMSQAADIYATNGVIKSPFLFKVAVMLLSGHRQVQSGDYLFDGAESVIMVAYRSIYGIEGLPKIKVTFFEAQTANDYAATLKKAIPTFDVPTFLALAKPIEGQLFPDTYYFYENSTPDDIVTLLHSTFIEKTKPLLLQIQAFGKSPEDIVTMASLVDKEASNPTDRRLIAGILWKRLQNNMPLQVDAAFYYLLGKDSAHLTESDLAVNSPYNLYKHTGLPPTPIGNPSLDAITDTLNPTPSDYLYFLSGKDGTMHYAATLADHVANKVKYLQ